MADVETKITENKPQISELEKIYNKYFRDLDQIDAIYHRMGGCAPTFIANVSEKSSGTAIESMVRDALNYGCVEDSDYTLFLSRFSKIRSMLANLIKLQNIQLKKVVLFWFRRYASNVRQLEGHLDLAVANAAIANGLGTSKDYETLISFSGYSSKKYLNDLIAQAKLDIKAEMANDVPSFWEIEQICRYVNVCAKQYKVPSETLALLNNEFNPEKIIAGGEHVSKFEKTIEVDHAGAEACKERAKKADELEEENAKLEKENKEAKKQNAELVATIGELQQHAAQMRASLCSRNVKKFQKMIAGITLPTLTK